MEREPTEKGGSWPARPANSLRSVVPARRGSSEDLRRHRHREGRKTGQGRGGSCACASSSSTSEPTAHPVHSGSPAPEVKSLPGGALPWGRGSGERRLRALLGPWFPDRRLGKMVYGGCTYSRRRCRRLRCCRRRLETPHPSACSRETRSLGGAWGLGRPPPPNRRPSFLQLHQPSTLPSASALLLHLERPANRAAAS